MAIRRRGTGPQILHSDQGSTYSTAQYRQMLAEHAIRQSMSRKGELLEVFGISRRTLEIGSLRRDSPTFL